MNVGNVGLQEIENLQGRLPRLFHPIRVQLKGHPLIAQVTGQRRQRVSLPSAGEQFHARGCGRQKRKPKACTRLARVERRARRALLGPRSQRPPRGAGNNQRGASAIPVKRRRGAVAPSKSPSRASTDTVPNPPRDRFRTTKLVPLGDGPAIGSGKLQPPKNQAPAHAQSRSGFDGKLITKAIQLDTQRGFHEDPM